MKKRFITIKNDDSGQRLDKVIPLYIEELTRGITRKLIANGSVYVNGKRTRKNSRLVRGNQTITIYIQETVDQQDPTGLAKPEIVPEIVLEDKWYVVVNKPSGVPSDETKQGIHGTLMDLLTRKYEYKYLQTVHRLDRDTSGLMVISKTPAATKHLNEQFRNREVTKKYIARVHGKIVPESKVIKSCFSRDPNDKRKFKSSDSGERLAVSRYRVLTYFEGSSLVEVDIETGRTHQIRVHLSEAGFPIIGDWLYGKREKCNHRMMLHACSLSFTCPRTSRKIQCHAEIPSRFSNPDLPV